MSHIDSYAHQLVGYLAGVRVYYALEDIEGSPQHGDFDCKAGQLVLGGGSGEWPGMVLDDPNAAVATFLALTGDEAVEKRGWADIITPWQFRDEALRFCAWRPEDYRHFVERCESPALIDPFREEADYSFIQWLLASFGQFVFHAMPELAPELMDQLDDPWTALKHPDFCNIVLTAPNTPTYANHGALFHPVRREPKKRAGF